MWCSLVGLIFEAPDGLRDNLPHSKEWLPMQPLSHLLGALAPEDDSIFLEACLITGRFANVDSSSCGLAGALPLLYHPLQSIRRKAASIIIKRGYINIPALPSEPSSSSQEEIISDLLLIRDSPLPVNQPIFEEVDCKVSALPLETNDLQSLLEAVELVGDEDADVRVRSNAAERVLKIISSKLWVLLPIFSRCSLKLWQVAIGN